MMFREFFLYESGLERVVFLGNESFYCIIVIFRYTMITWLTTKPMSERCWSLLMKLFYESPSLSDTDIESREKLFECNVSRRVSLQILTSSKLLVRHSVMS